MQTLQERYVVLARAPYGGARGPVYSFASREAANEWASKNSRNADWATAPVLVRRKGPTYALLCALEFGGVRRALVTYPSPIAALRSEFAAWGRSEPRAVEVRGHEPPTEAATETRGHEPATETRGQAPPRPAPPRPAPPRQAPPRQAPLRPTAQELADASAAGEAILARLSDAAARLVCPKPIPRRPASSNLTALLGSA